MRHPSNYLVLANGATSENYDHRGLYDFDFITQPLNPQTKTVALDYIRQAISFTNNTPDMFYDEYCFEISQLIDYISTEESDLEIAEKFFELKKQYIDSIIHKNQISLFEE